MLKEFAAFRVATVHASDGAWTGRYIFGRQTYAEIFSPEDGDEKRRSPAGTVAIALGGDRAGVIATLQQRLESAGIKAISERRRRRFGDRDADSFRSLPELTTALPFVELANTDEHFMTVHNEAILMASAFEQLFDGNGEKYISSPALATPSRSSGTPRLPTRRRFGLISESTPRIRHGQQRNQDGGYIRSGSEVLQTSEARQFIKVRLILGHGLSVFEHLVMAAHVFPLAVKLLLAKDGHYTLSDTDRARGLSVDKLLAAAQWAHDREAESRESWSSIESRTRRDLAGRRRGRQLDPGLRPGLQRRSFLGRDPRIELRARRRIDAEAAAETLAGTVRKPVPGQ